MKVYFKNATPFLPIESSERQAKEQLFVDLIHEFDMNEYVRLVHDGEYIEVLGKSLPISVVVSGLPYEVKKDLTTQYAIKHAQNIIESTFEKLQTKKHLDMCLIVGMQEQYMIKYSVWEFESPMTDEGLRAYLKSKNW